MNGKLLKTFSFLLILGCIALYSPGCGSGSNLVSVCNTAIHALYQLCDPTTEVTTIQNIFADFGYYPTELEIQTTSESEAKDELCVLDEGADDITAQQKELLEAAIDDATSCEDLEDIADAYGYLFL